MNTCRSCGAPVIWVAHKVTGKRAPLDEQPTTAGNIAIESGGYRVLGKSERAHWVGQLPLYTNHFATCKQASQWRAGSKGKA
jgi:hypothetical protein